MSGRYRALLVAVASSGSLLFAWIGAAVVALVTLRKGAGEGAWVLLWALLPALLLTRISGDSSALALLLGTAGLALLLRSTVNLTLTALCSAAVAVLTGLALYLFGQELLALLAAAFEDFFQALADQARQDGGAAVELQPPNELQLAGMMGTANGALSFLCLSLARYWQSALYNPGGFGSEFRALRFPPTVVAALMIAAAALAALGFSYRSWAAALLLPLSVAGFALLHAWVRRSGQGRLWLTVAYMLWLLLDGAKLLLMGLVAVDALMNFRGRWARRAAPPTETPPTETPPAGDREPDNAADRSDDDASGKDE